MQIYGHSRPRYYKHLGGLFRVLIGFKAIVKTFELADVPVRAGRFIARKNWIVCGSDDFQLRVYNYNTSERITSFEAHPDYIRAIVVSGSSGRGISKY